MQISSGRIIRQIALALFVLVFVVGLACDNRDYNDPAQMYSSAAEQLTDEYGFDDVNSEAVDRVIDISKDLVLESRGSGVSSFIDELKAALALRGLDGSSLDAIQDYSLGQPLPGIGEYFESPSDDVSSQQMLLTEENPNKQFYECPPMDLTGKDSCFQIIDMVKAQVKSNLSNDSFYKTAQNIAESDAVLKEQSDEFIDYSKAYLGNLAKVVHIFGIDVAAIRAEYTLREAGVCDNEKIDGREIARLRGIEESIQILRKLIGKEDFQLAPKGEECTRIGQTGAEAQAKIKKAIDEWEAEHILCPDMSQVNDQVRTASQVRREGIEHGIVAHTTTIWVGTIRNGIKHSGTSYTVACIDGCQPKDQVRYTTSPLVVDLDGDGLQLSTERVRFDLRATGQPQRVTWVGPREGLLAMDLDGDGRVTSGRELFGNHSDCLANKCADGAAALAVHDHPAMGGNADGRIDSSDKVFDALRIWVDRNRDGRSQPGEVGSMSDHGIKALSLKASYFDRQVPAGRISLSLEVHTDNGLRTAYDVWFNNTASAGFPTPLF